MNLQNCKHVSCFKCKNCNETKEIIYDDVHGEIVCLKCGFVLSEVVERHPHIFVKREKS